MCMPPILLKAFKNKETYKDNTKEWKEMAEKTNLDGNKVMEEEVHESSLPKD